MNVTRIGAVGAAAAAGIINKKARAMLKTVGYKIRPLHMYRVALESFKQVRPGAAFVS